MKKHLFLPFFILVASLSSVDAVGQMVTASGSSPSKYIKITRPIPRPTSPARLVIDQISFVDADGNRIINAGESGRISFRLSNQGTGTAYAVVPKVMVDYPSVVVGSISKLDRLETGKSVEMSVSVSSDLRLDTRTSIFTITANEGNGFNAPEQLLAIKTKSFDPPRVVVADTKFLTNTGGVKASLGSIVTMQVLVQNQGLGTAKNVNLEFIQPPKDVFKLTDMTNVQVGDLKPGEQKTYEYKFLINNAFAQQNVNIKTVLSESSGLYGQQKDNQLPIDGRSTPQTVIEIAGNYAAPLIVGGSLSSDVDANIPKTSLVNDHVFALIIGNEHYTAMSGSVKEIDVPYAIADAASFEQYCMLTLGIPRENIMFRRDGTGNQMNNDIERLCTNAATYPSVDGRGAQVMVYYAGHGLCDNEKNSYLVPVDVPGTQVNNGVSLSSLYRRLGGLSGVRSTVVIDACFSGGARDGVLLAARGLKVVPNPDVIPGQLVVFSATSEKQTALPYTDKKHGMFTYFFLKKLQESGGTGVEYGDMAKYLEQQVTHYSNKLNNSLQTPTTLVGIEVQNSWNGWKF